MMLLSAFAPIVYLPKHSTWDVLTSCWMRYWTCCSSTLLIACREGYLERTMRSLASLRGLERFSLYVSQDGDHPGVARLVQSTGKDLMATASVQGFQHWQHPRKPVLGAQQVCPTAYAALYHSLSHPQMTAHLASSDNLKLCFCAAQALHAVKSCSSG